MASFTITGFFTTPQTLSSGENGFVARSGTLFNSTTRAVTMHKSSDLLVEGSVAGHNGAVYMETGGNLIVTGTGSVSATSAKAVDIGGQSGTKTISNAGTIHANVSGIGWSSISHPDPFTLQVVNSGTITGVDFAGVAAFGTGGSSGYVSNSGTIQGGSTGAQIHLLDTGTTFRIENSGTIKGGTYGIENTSFSADVSVVMVNTGLIASGDAGGDFVGIRGGQGTDKLVNAGHVQGNIVLRDGDDVFRGRFGTVNGTVDGGDGDDVLRGGDAADDLLGGAGRDTLNGFAGDDDILGGSGRDTLRGGSGADNLRGGAGNDLLVAGTGDDTLSGGSGGDTFVLKRNSGDNLITDFENGADEVDLTAFGLRTVDFATIVLPALSKASGNSVMLDLSALGGSGSVLIQGLSFGDADVSDFIL